MAREIDDTTLAKIEAEMRGDGVWIDADFAREHGISAADESRLEQLVAGADHADLRMLLVDVARDDDRFHGRAAHLVAWVQDSVGGDATYLGWERYGDPQLTVVTYGDQPSADAVARIAEREHPDDLVEALARSEQLLEDGNARELWEAIPREERYPWTADDGGLQQWLGDATLGQWVLLGAGVAVVLTAGYAWWSRRRGRRTGDEFVLPTAVLRSVRLAEDKQVRERAEREVLGLGEALGAQDPDARSLEVWQQALDHYDAARSVLARAGSPADVVGALVLARRGDAARAAALPGAPDGAGAGAATTLTWHPPTPCFFNPLHDGPVRRVTWHGDDRSVEVPACEACAVRVEQDREPDDVLDFVAQGSTVHYFRLDIGAWSRTGYGALDPDLLGALRSRQGRRPR
ncbi:hypothetical protein [Nocardioides daphniae]|uniref:Uncharacterized protein n=1 Tax=Nocardioides daphniae TaxID=402297 RepID=A0A4P7U9N1_9ACTN|nr:hypothetical protein [Nocardioides daphniae]QCC76676.1 hypothetical protein E2C04_04610 [Nocardioides daphniae]GGD15238.1 hypothetical protein GCM10007231_12800 [Nocardioides daphniae]